MRPRCGTLSVLSGRNVCSAETNVEPVRTGVLRREGSLRGLGHADHHLRVADVDQFANVIARAKQAPQAPGLKPTSELSVVRIEAKDASVTLHAAAFVVDRFSPFVLGRAPAFSP